jgi:hypothetical protein
MDNLSPSTHSPQRGSEGGFTVVEIAMAVVLTAILLGVTSKVVVSVTTVSRDSNLALREDSHRRSALATIANELRASSLERGEVQILGGGTGIRFRSLVGMFDEGTEVSGVWSDPTTIELVGDRIVRRQGEIRSVIASGIRSLEFRRPTDARFLEIECVTRHRGRDTVRTLRVFPSS